jgi:hypothetical protein
MPRKSENYEKRAIYLNALGLALQLFGVWGKPWIRSRIAPAARGTLQVDPSALASQLQTVELLSWGLVASGTVLLVLGCASLAKARGWPVALGAIGALSLLGWATMGLAGIFLAVFAWILADLLPDKNASPPQTWRQQFRDWGRLFANSYLAIDRRTLGLLRILLGFFLIMDLCRRGFDWEEMFGDIGVLPTWVILNRPQAGGFSLLHGFTTGPELWVLFAVIMVTYVGLFVGYKTKVCQILSLVFVTSMNGRVLLIENGGYVVHNLLLLWTCFLPLGDRFSVDAMLTSMRRKRERTAAELNDRSDLMEAFRLAPYYSLVGLVFCLQIAAIYYFNVKHKTGPAWKSEFTAVHYVMYVDRMVNPLIGQVREHVPFVVYRVMTVMVIGSELLLAFAALLPQLVLGNIDVRLWLKRLAVVLMNFLHIGFGSTFVLGPFAWALCVMSVVFFSHQDWELSARAMRKQHRERTVIFDPGSGAALFFCRLLARMDKLDLLGFDEGKESGHRIAVLTPKGEIKTGRHAIADIVEALPIGPAFAWMFRGLPFGPLVDWAMRSFQGRASRALGLTTALPPAVETPPARRYVKGTFAVFRELICFAMLLGAINQALVELWSTKKGWAAAIKSLNDRYGWQVNQQPEPMRILTHKMRFLQGWFMFSPNPVMDDGTIIVDAITVDGRHVDPFWAEPPNFDLLNAKSFGYNQIWSDYFNRMHSSGNRAYRDAMVDYMRRLPERTGNPNDKLVSGTVYWVKDMNPKWNTTKSWNEQRETLFTFDETGGAKDPKTPPKSDTDGS